MYLKANKINIEAKRLTKRGMYISKVERNNLKEIVKETIKQNLILWAELKFKLLMSANTPKSMFGSFFSKETTTTPRTGDKVVRPEWELRFAGDFGFMLQDYNNANVNYKRLQERLQKTAAGEDVGCCKEAIAITTLILEGNIKEFTKAMEVALQSFSKAKNMNLLIKNSIYTSDILMITGKYLEAAEYLKKIINLANTDIQLHALLLEQAAIATIKSSPLLIRKFTKDMMTAGIVYSYNGLNYNAIFCLHFAFSLYEKINWPGILICICKYLSKSLETIDHSHLAFPFYKRLIEVLIEWPNEGNQNTYFQSFINSAIKHKAQLDKELIHKRFEMNMLLHIFLDSVVIFTEQDKMDSNVKELLSYKGFDIVQPLTRGYIREGKYNTPQLWITLRKMIDGDIESRFENNRNTKQMLREEELRDLYFYDERSSGKRVILYTKKKRFVYVNEKIYLRFVCKNPLAATLNLTELKIKCHYSGGDSSNTDLEVQNEPITLEPNEQREMMLWIVPKRKGELIINGVQWTISNCITGKFTISDVIGKRSQIVMIVRHEVGRLEIKTDKDLRLNYFDGETDSYKLYMKNVGTLPISKITLQTDYPLLFGWKNINLDWTLNPNEEKEIEIQFRAEVRSGFNKLMPKILIRYLSDIKNSYYRYIRIEHLIDIQHLFVLRKDFARSKTNLTEYYLNVQIEKLCVQNAEIIIDGIFVAEEDWAVKQKNKSPMFGNTFAGFFALSYHPSIPLEQRHILFSNDNKVDIGFLNSNQKHIKEFKDAKSKHNCTINTLLSWTLKMKEKTITGFSFVPITISGGSKDEYFPLQVEYKYEKENRHNFERETMCKVNLELLIRNRTDQDVSFRFETLNYNEDNDSHSSDFIWQGSTIKNIRQLAPKEECKVHLVACMMIPGTYDLNRFNFIFFKDRVTGKYLDPSKKTSEYIITKIYELESEQILTNIIQSSEFNL